jgi:hypothetical protein
MWPFTPKLKPIQVRTAPIKADFSKLFDLAARQSSAKVAEPSTLEKDETFPYTPLEVQDRSQLASSLETILQGNKVDPDIFLKLYRGGYVFKSTGGAWRITERGKELVDKHKLIAPEAILINGIPCLKKWNQP